MLKLKVHVHKHLQAKPLIKANKIKELVDPSLGDGYELEQLNVAIAIASICIHQSAVDRPDMSQACSFIFLL